MGLIAQSWLDLPDGMHRCRWADGRDAFVKLRRGMPDTFFAAEANGFAALAATATVRVPEVWAVANDGIALEDLGRGHARTVDWERAGCALAALHAATVAQFGFGSDGWCGDSAQDNHADDDGFRFFAERRLLPQGNRACDAGLLQRADVGRIERICERLSDLLPPSAASLVHGDLWLGNLHACADGELALIDGGAVHCGWPETDLAMLTLFGEPPAAFFSAYEATAGVNAAWRERAPLLNLYHLLNHLNLFGASYRAAVIGVLAAYA